MGTSLTGLEIRDTYDSLIKVTDNGPLSGTLKALSDGLGTDSTLSLSTTAASIAGTLAVTGATTLSSSATIGSSAYLGTAGIATVKTNSTILGATSELGLLIANDGTLNDLAQIGFGYSESRSAAVIAGIISTSSGSTTSDLLFATRSGTNGATAPVERMRITSAGLVGIGTSAPSVGLHVSAGQFLTCGIAIGGGADVNSGLRIKAPIATTNYNWLIGAQENINNGFEITPSTAVGGTTFSTPALSILGASGKVGIGTSSPAGQLHISGDGAASNLIRLQNTGAGTNGFFDISVTSTEAQLNANYASTAIPMLFLTGAAERMRITSTGVVELAQGQIKFPATQVASADPNTLDDYEEGTWTPVIAGNVTAGTGTYTQQVGKYTKIGNVVRIHFSIQWTAHTGTGVTTVTGFPFASGAGAQTPFSVFTYGETMTAGNVPNGGIMSNGATLWEHWQVPTGGGASSGILIYNGIGEIQVSGTYSV